MPREKKPAIGNTALDMFMSTAQAEDPVKSRPTDNTEYSEHTGNKRKKERVTVHITPGINDKIRDICYWDHDTIADFIESAVLAEIERRETCRGEAYPPREKELRAGRPVR
jgi:hypothetical protein